MANYFQTMLFTKYQRRFLNILFSSTIIKRFAIENNKEKS